MYALLTPEKTKRALYPLLAIIKRRFPALKQTDSAAATYDIRVLHPVRPWRPVIIHAIANFVVGGSSRLVVDLIEHLGHKYDQRVITGYCTDPPAYSGAITQVIRHSARVAAIVALLRDVRPDIVHVHYWGKIDKSWYNKIFEAADQAGCRIIENINTPVKPYISSSISHFIYVSNYVQERFGAGTCGKERVIYPGSDFSLFSGSPDNNSSQDCIGMVYRLEIDKLNKNSIDVFIKLVKQRPNTKVLIVGGGTYLAPYKRAALRNGVLSAFTFTDYVPYRDLPSYYRQMGVFVAPVWQESFGHVSPIAMHMGLPVVGYDVGALREIIDDTDLLARPGDSDKLAAIIIDLLDNRQKRLSIGAKNKNRARQLFSLDKMIQEYDELYDIVLRAQK